MIAIGGGGYVPARILRSFLKRPGAPNIPIQAIGLSLYEQLPSSTSAGHPNGIAAADPDVETPGTKVTRTQWLDLSSLEMANLIGKNILIVDEVDDTRTTLEYAVRELIKDVETARKLSGRNAEEGKTTFSVFVLHVRSRSSDISRNRILANYFHENRTRRRKSEGICRRTCSSKIAIWQQERWVTCGSTIPGKQRMSIQRLFNFKL